MEDTRRMWPTESTKQGKHGFFVQSKEIEASSTRPTWVCRRPSVYMLWPLTCFVGPLTMRVGVSLTPSPLLETFFLLLGSPILSQ